MLGDRPSLSPFISSQMLSPMNSSNTGCCNGGYDGAVQSRWAWLCVLGTHVCKLFFSAPSETHIHLHLFHSCESDTHCYTQPPFFFHRLETNRWLWILGASEKLQVTPSTVSLCLNPCLHCSPPRLHPGGTDVCRWGALSSSKRSLPGVPVSGRPGSLPAPSLPQRPLWSPSDKHLLQE